MPESQSQPYPGARARPAPLRRAAGALLALLSLTGCLATPTPTPNPLLAPPNLAGYQKITGAEVVSAVRSGGLLGSVFQGDPRYAVVAAFTTQAAQCAIDQNIANLGLYTQTGDLSAAGVVAIVSETQLTNPTALLACLPAATDAPDSPCSAQYQFTSDGATYRVFYAATKPAVCTALCAALPQCH
jgi:hypothetical protein